MNLYQDGIAGLDRSSILSSSQLLWIIIARRYPFLSVGSTNSEGPYLQIFIAASQRGLALGSTAIIASVIKVK